MTTDTAIEMYIPRSGDARVFQVKERKLDPPAAGEVRVAIEAAGVAYADIVVRRGLYERAKLPITPGYDLVGRITALGPNVPGLTVGQRVAGITVFGSYATQRNVDARWLVPAPERVAAPRLVAAVLNGVTAWQMLHRIAAPEPGEWVLVHGAAGGVGSILVDLARRHGALVVGTASSAKLQALEERGAVPLDHTKVDVAGRAREVSSGGVVAAFDHLGGAHLRRRSIAALRECGVAVFYGGYDVTRNGKVHLLAGVQLLAGTLSSYRLMDRSQGVVGYLAPVWRDLRTEAYRRDLASVLDAVARDEISPLVGATFPLFEAASAHRALETRSVAGKIVLEMAP